MTLAKCDECGVTRPWLQLRKVNRHRREPCFPPYPNRKVCFWHLEETPDDYPTDYEQLRKRAGLTDD